MIRTTTHPLARNTSESFDTDPQFSHHLRASVAIYGEKHTGIGAAHETAQDATKRGMPRVTGLGNSERASTPTANIAVPKSASSKSIALACLRRMGLPSDTALSSATLTAHLCRAIHQQGIQTIVLDELEHLKVSDSEDKRSQEVREIRHWINQVIQNRDLAAPDDS